MIILISLLVLIIAIALMADALSEAKEFKVVEVTDTYLLITRVGDVKRKNWKIYFRLQTFYSGEIYHENDTVRMQQFLNFKPFGRITITAKTNNHFNEIGPFTISAIIVGTNHLKYLAYTDKNTIMVRLNNSQEAWIKGVQFKLLVDKYEHDTEKLQSQYIVDNNNIFIKKIN